MTLEKVQEGSKRLGRIKGMACCWWISMGYLFSHKK